MKKLSCRRKGDERGAVLVMAAASLVLVMISAALAIDLGRLSTLKRFDQKIADLAALDAVRNLSRACALAKDSAFRNGFDPADIDCADPANDPAKDVVIGRMDAATREFVADPAGGAVKVVARSAFSTAFPFVGGPDGVSATAVSALSTSLGTVRVGSHLVALDSTQATILNRLLTNVIGGTNTVSLSGVGWNGIASGNVSFSRLRAALGYSAGSAEGVLNASITYRQLLDATVAALNADGSPSSVAAATPLASIASQVSATFGAAMKLKDLFEIVGNAGNGEDVADASLRVMDIVQGGAILADGDHFATANLAAADVAAFPGFNNARLSFGLIEAPQMKSGSPGKDASNNYMTTARTSQIRVRLDLTLKLPVAGLGEVEVTVPYYLNAGNASASLDALRCTSSSTPTSVDIWGTTEQASSSLGFMSDANLSVASPPAPVPGPPILSAAGLVTVGISNAVTTTIPGNPGVMRTFLPPYSATSAPQPVPGTSITLPALTATNLTVATLGLALLDTNAIKLDIVNGVAAAVGPTTTNILSPLYGALGLSFGSADVWAPPPQDCTPQSYFNPNAPPNPAGVPTLAK